MDSQTTEKIELPNQCLGAGCTEMLPKGKHTCDRCQRKINQSSKFAAKMMSSKGFQKKSTIRDF
ncbi:MAG: hypothetical protein Q7J54_00105 [Candidatus Woesearchaeota archaeon]|nr:hypothetical protein [Candidatus Woesearchaeota archaeon]